jgi:hypothetical protein
MVSESGLGARFMALLAGTSGDHQIATADSDTPPAIGSFQADGSDMISRRSPSLIISHWSRRVEDLQVSSQWFYARVEEGIRRRQIPEAVTIRIDWREGIPFSARREYLRVIRKDYVFDICGASFGRGFFVAWWLGKLPHPFLKALSRIRGIGAVADPFVRPATYYSIDTALMFQSAIHSTVLEIIDEISTSRGIRLLSEVERKPTLGGLYDTYGNSYDSTTEH